MSKINFKPGNMIYPLPAVMVSCGDIETESNILTVAWTGTICTNPPMAYISVRPERYSYDMIKKSGEFVINLTTEQLIKATDFCGVRSGRDVYKWLKCNLTKEKADTVKCPLIAESPVNIECKVTEIKELGSHHMFIADVTDILEFVIVDKEIQKICDLPLGTPLFFVTRQSRLLNKKTVEIRYEYCSAVNYRLRI